MLIRILILLACAGMARSAVASPASWLEVRSNHFTVFTDATEPQGRRVLEQLEHMRWVFQTLFPKANLDPSSPIIVLAVADRQEFQSLEPASYLAKGQMDLAGCFFRAADRNYVLLRLDSDQAHPYATVYHEYTHLEFGSMSDWLPLWLNEGLAEFFENTQVAGQDVVLGQPSQNDILLLRQSKLIPLPELFRVDVTSPYYHEEQKGSLFYAESWALTHYLEVSDREKGTERLSRYFALMGEHEDPVVAAEKAFGDLSELQSALSASIQASTFQQLVLTQPSETPVTEQALTRSLPAEEANLIRAEMLTNVGRTREARVLLDSVLRDEPENVRAVEGMGFLEYREGNHEAARSWYSKAIQLDARNYLPYYYHAVMTMSAGIGPNDASAETSLHTALRLKPDFAPALDQLALFYALHRNRLDDAKSFSMRAMELDPSSFRYRMDASSILMALQDFSEAESVTQAAVRVATRPEQWQAGRSRLAQLRQIEVDRADRNMMAELRDDGRGGADIVVIDKGARRGREMSESPNYQAEGVISKVTCHYPFVIDFQVVGARRSVMVSNSNYLALDLTAVGFTPKNEMDPCKDFEGRHARVQYAESPDKSVDGKVTAIELRN